MLLNFNLQALPMGSSVFAQTPTPTAVPAAPAPSPETLSPISQFLSSLGLGGIGPTLLNLIGAVLILIIGWIVAAIAAGIVGKLLKRTDVDNRLARSLMSRPGQAEPNIERIISAVVFWVILLLAIVAFLNALNLTTVSQPLNSFLNSIFSFLPKLGAAAVLGAVAWVLATLAKAIVIRTARSFDLDGRITQPTEPGIGAAPTGGEPQFLLSETLGNVLYWFIFLFFLPLILGVLDLQGPLQPVQNLLNDFLAALPRIFKAVLIAGVGWVIARIVRGIVSNLLTATGIDRVGSQLGLRGGAGSQSLSRLIGTIVYILILLPTAIAALDALQIPAIAGPATAMLNQILNTLPQIFTAALILIVGYVVARFVADLVSNLLAGIGFNNLFESLGFQGFGRQARPDASVDPSFGGEPTTGQPFASSLGGRTPSDIAGFVVLVGILLFATVAATNVLNIPAITAIVSGLLVVFGRVLVGLVVFAIGLYLANLAFNLITSSGTGQSRILGQVARIAIIGLVTAMALQQMGIAASIVNLAFGLLLGAVAIAIAIAFGLGGRSVAATQLEEWLAHFRRR